MTRQELYNLCGLPLKLSIPTEPKWTTVELRFIGGEHYVLGTKRVQACIKQVQRGVSLMFKDRLQIPAGTLLGKRKVEGKLVDVEVVIGEVVLSLAKMGPVKYPIVLRNKEMVDLV